MVAEDPNETSATEPVHPYASIEDAKRYKPPRPPRRIFRWAVGLLTATWVLGAVAFGVADGVLVGVLLAGWGVALGAAITAQVSASRNRHVGLPARDRLGLNRVRFVRGLSFVGLLGQTGLCVHGCDQVFGGFVFSQVARTNLAFIGEVTSMYFNDSGQSPESLDDLVAAGHLPPHQLRAPFDNAPGYSAAPPYYKSYVFQPGPRIDPKEPTIVVAYERDGLTPIDFRLIEHLGHCVLFGDGHVECLNTAELNDALARDRKRRIELGWAAPPGR